MEKIITKILKFFSKLVLKKYKPEIIAITGSLGKTSAKEAISQMLGSKYRIWQTKGNFNNQIGVPFTILGIDKSPKKSIVGWIIVFIKSFMLVIKTDKNYPKKIVVEMGADHVGDIEYLVDFIDVSIGVLTKIASVHLEFFKSIDNILKEKTKIFKNIKKDGWAVINIDDDKLRDYRPRITHCNVMTYGIDIEADVWATDLQIIRKEHFVGMNFKIRYKGNVIPIFLPRALGKTQVYAFLAGASVALIHGINLVEISILADKYFSPRGRTNLLKAINNSNVIDDTYNSSPQAVKMALNLLYEIKEKEIIKGKITVVLSDMLEIGASSEDRHREIGRYIAEKGLNSINYLLTTGNMAKYIKESAISSGFDQKFAMYFESKKELTEYLKTIIENDDLILVKGSRGTKMERVVYEIMADKHLADNLLVSDWKDAI